MSHDAMPSRPMWSNSRPRPSADADEHTGQEQQTGYDLDDQIAQARGERPRRSPCPDEKHGAEREHLPEQKEGEQIARENGADGAAGIDQAGCMLHGIANVQRKHDADEGGEVEQNTEQSTQGVYPHRAEAETHHVQRHALAHAPGQHQQRAHDGCAEQHE